MLVLSNRGLTHLYLDSNHVEDEGVEHLATGLKQNSTLQYLNLNNNKITQRGLQTMAAAMTSHNSSL